MPIHYESVGEGSDVLLLHGFTSDFRETWVETGWVRDLNEAGFRCIGIDVRGHGLSGKPHEPDAYGPARLTEDVISVMDVLRLRTARGIGFSMGGGILLNLAFSRPERLMAGVVAGVGDSAIDGDDDLLEAVIAALEGSGADRTGNHLAIRVGQLASRPSNDRRALAAMARAWRLARAPARPGAPEGAFAPGARWTRRVHAERRASG